MSRALLIAAVWAVLIALTVLLAHLASPEPRQRSSLGFGAIAEEPIELEVAYPAPIAAQADERTTFASPTPITNAPAQAAPTTPPPANPKRTFPAREGATESGIPGLGSLPAGPGAAYQGLGVQVFSRSTGQAVVGARVRFALQAQLDEWQRAHPETPLDLADPETILELCTQPVQTKSHGVALADSAPGRMLVDARVGTQYGFAWVDRDKEARARIDLVEDHTLSVRVIAAGSAPLGNAGVVVRDSSCTQLWRGVTDAHGRARWPHAAFVIERDASPGNCVALVEFVTLTSGTYPHVNEIQRPFGAQEELYFRLQTPAGSLRVTVVDTDGKRVDEPLRLSCGYASWGGGELSNFGCSEEVDRTLDHGSATFEHVERDFGPDIRIDGGSVFESVVRKDPQGIAENETREVTLTCGRRFPVVRARLVGPDGKPLAKVTATAWHESDDAGEPFSLEALQRVGTDDAGAVRFTLPFAPGGKRTMSKTKDRFLILTHNEFGDWCFAETVELQTALAEGELDLGERHLTEMPTLASGYALADRGWPVPNAVIEVSASDDLAADPESFTAYPRFAAVADQMGRFRLRGLVPGSRIALTASAPDHMRPPRRIVERGERKLALELTRCASISGNIMLAPSVPAENTHVWIDLADESIPAAIDANLKWRCAGLPPGNAGLRVTIDDMAQSVYAVPALVLAPGIEFTDPQSTTIDLRARVTRISLRVLNADDKPIGSASAVVTEQREEGPFTRTLAIENGVLEVLALRPTVDIEIHAAGFETLALTSVANSGKVKLGPVGEK